VRYARPAIGTAIASTGLGGHVIRVNARPGGRVLLVIATVAISS